MGTIPPQIISWVVTLACILITAYICSLGARLHWALDLFSHFTIQYAIGGILIGSLLLFFHRYPLAVLCFTVALLNIAETRHLMQDPWLFKKPQEATNFIIVQHNRFYLNNNYKKLRKWLDGKGKNVDVLLVQESKPETIEKLKSFKDIFPYQFPENVEQRHGDVSILSHYPFTVTYLPIEGVHVSKYLARIEIKKEGLEPLIIYNHHTKVPMGGRLMEYRNEELSELARTIKNDNAQNIIASGDWNITPYSPFFTDFLKISGLHYQNYDFLPETTWAAHVLFPFFKIPIDHVLFSDRLILTNIQRGPAMGSDHHSLIASFKINKSGK